MNRLSLGLQSLNNSSLTFLGRAHDASAGLAALHDALSSGIARVCADLIFGLPGQSPRAAVSELLQLPLNELSHLSVYALTIEKNTPFGTLARAGRLPLAADDVVADTFSALHEALTGAQFEHYEISNYARLGQRSVHNMGYWQGRDYLGLGVAAYGTVTARAGPHTVLPPHRLRYRNTTRIRRYLEMRESSDADLMWQLQPTGLLAEREPIDDATALVERLMLGLRTQEGISIDALATEFDIDPWLSKRRATVEKLVRQGRLLQEGANLRIPFDAWFLADGIISELM